MDEIPYAKRANDTVEKEQLRSLSRLVLREGGQKLMAGGMDDMIEERWVAQSKGTSHDKTENIWKYGFLQVEVHIKGKGQYTYVCSRQGPSPPRREQSLEVDPLPMRSSEIRDSTSRCPLTRAVAGSGSHLQSTEKILEVGRYGPARPSTTQTQITDYLEKPSGF